MTPHRLTAAAFKLDPASRSVVVCCQDCAWRDVAADRAGAWSAAALHARAYHPGQVTAALKNASYQAGRKLRTSRPD